MPPGWFDKAQTRRALGAFFVAMTVAAAIAFVATARLSSSREDVTRFGYGDGLIYRYVASHLTTPPENVHQVVRERGIALRYGRIGLPAMIWVLAGGQAQAMIYSHLFITLVAAGAAGAASAYLLPRAPTPLVALVSFAAPGFVVAVSGGFAEAPAVAFVLWAVVAVIRERPGWAAVAMAVAMFTRENSAFVLLGFIAWYTWQRKMRAVIALSGSVVPIAAWYVFAARRWGHVPPLDPYLRVTTETVGPPLIALARSLFDPASSDALATLLVHVALAALMIRFASRSLFAVIGTAAAAQLLVTGRFGWQFVGEAFRTGVLLQLAAVLTIIEVWMAARRSSETGATDALRAP